MKSKRSLVFTAIFSLLMSSIAVADDPANLQDPYQHLNQKTFKFNSDLDEALFQPLAKSYACLVPRPVRTSIGNFFQNFIQPSVVANDILQGDYLNAIGDSWRFVINSTFGVFGLFDVAGQMNVPIPYRANDFGLTLRVWGLNDPKYFVIPFFGPSTDVDVLGRVVNYYAFTPYIYIHPWYDRSALLALYYVNERAQLLDYNNLLEVAALDPYVFQRDAYLQHRQSQFDNIKQTLHSEYNHSERTPVSEYFLKPSDGNKSSQ